MTFAIEVVDFRKTFKPGLFKKPFEAARGISFRVERGTIFGFLGPNGAGKTTTIKALLGLIRPDSGVLRLLGEDVASGRWRGRVGYLPEHPNFYEYLTGRELVAWFARLSGYSAIDAGAEADRLLARVGLGHAKDRRLRSYSKGMLQRAGIAQALIGDPELLILDEPMTGLDPLGRHEVRQVILGLRGEGKTVIYSTHILPDVEMTCDRVGMIDQGRVLAVGPLDEIMASPSGRTTVVFSGVSEGALAWLGDEGHPLVQKGGAVSLELPDLDSARRMLARGLEHGLHLERFEQHRESLESVFVASVAAARAAGKPKEGA